MKVLHIITTISRGGAENHLKDLITLQRKDKHDVKILCLKGTNYWKNYYENIGIEVFNVELENYFSVKPIRKLFSVLKTYEPHILHAHLEPCEFYSWILLFFLKNIKFVITKHNQGGVFKKNFFTRKLMCLIAKKAVAVIAISESTKQEFITLGIPEKKIHTVYHGIDTLPFDEVNLTKINDFKSSLNLSKDDFLIGTVARLIECKSIDTLIRAFAKYKADTKKAARLVIVGEGELEDSLISLVKQLSIEKDVTFTGFREDIPTIMSVFDIFCLPSTSEGFGIVLLEAMAAGKPIIVSNISSLPEIVSDSAITFTPKNHFELAKCITFMENPVNRTKYMLNSLRRVKFFSLGKMYDKVSSIYNL